MFEWLFGKNRIQIRHHGRSRLMYKDGKKKMFISFEWEAPDGAVRIDTYSIRNWEVPFEKELIDSARKQEILNNLKTYLEERGATVRLY